MGSYQARRDRWILYVALAVFVVGVTCWMLAINHAQSSSQPGRFDRIEEDEPGWDCATMGNRVCGTTTIPAAGVDMAWECWWETNLELPEGVEKICAVREG